MTEEANFTDPRDGKIYKTVKIGDQIWMAENLAYAAKDSKVCDNDENNCQKYGGLYDFTTAMQISCPEGWHLPSKKEWQVLVDFAGGDEVAGKILKASSGWNENGNGTDALGFSALPGCYCMLGSYYRVGISAAWWSSSLTEGNRGQPYSISIDHNHDGIDHNCNRWGNWFLISIRCIKD